jgi:anti-anti-sigma factor
MLEFNTALEKDVWVIELEGALDSVSAADFRSYFQDKINSGYRAFALDCLCLEYISSAGIGAIIDLRAQLEAKGGKLVLFQLATETRQLLRFLKLEEKLTIVSDYDEAIAALTGYRRVIPEEDIVAPEELKIIDEKNSEPAEAQAAPATTPGKAEASPLAVETDEMVIEELVGTEKKGLHSMNVEKAAKTAEAPTVNKEAATQATSETSMGTEKTGRIPEAQELKLNTGTKRLISCPNCKSVLRVAVAGDYLCPACRFRFSFRPNA